MVAISRKAHEANLFAENGLYLYLPKNGGQLYYFLSFLFEELAFEPQ